MRTPFHAQFQQRYLKPTVFAAAMMSSLAFTACGDNSVTAVVTVSQVVGVRPMNSANNKSLPATFTDGSGKQLTIKSGSLTIAADGKFILHYVGNLGALAFDLSETGTVTVEGNALNFVPDDDDAPFAGSTSAGKISAGFKIAGVKFVLGFQS